MAGGRPSPVRRNEPDASRSARCAPTRSNDFAHLTASRGKRPYHLRRLRARASRARRISLALRNRSRDALATPDTRRDNSQKL